MPKELHSIEKVLSWFSSKRFVTEDTSNKRNPHIMKIKHINIYLPYFKKLILPLLLKICLRKKFSLILFKKGKKIYCQTFCNTTLPMITKYMPNMNLCFSTCVTLVQFLDD